MGGGEGSMKNDWIESGKRIHIWNARIKTVRGLHLEHKD